MKSYFKYFALGLILVSSLVSAQSAIIRGEASPGVYQNLQSVSQRLQVDANISVPTATAVDPCASLSIAKSSAVVNIITAATTQLVAPSGSTVIYVCSIALTVSQVITTPNTIQFISGTGGACAGGLLNRTGLIGDGGVTAGPPLVFVTGTGATIFKTTGTQGLCAVTAIGATASFQGLVTYVQQ